MYAKDSQYTMVSQKLLLLAAFSLSPSWNYLLICWLKLACMQYLIVSSALPLALFLAAGIYLVTLDNNLLANSKLAILFAHSFELGLIILGASIYLLLCKFVRKLYAPHQHQPSELTASLLGYDKFSGRPVVLSDVDANHHTLVVGTTGTGKTNTICNIVEHCIQQGNSLFYVDGKGDIGLAKRVAAFANQYDRPCYIFSMVGDSVRYNPLANGGYTSKKDRIIELRHWSEEHYRKLAEGYLQTVLLAMEQLGIPSDLYTVAKYLDLDELYLIARKQKNQALLDKLYKLEQKYKNIDGLIAEIDNLINSEIGHLFDCSKGKVLTLLQAQQEKAIVYFCLSPLAYPAYASTLGKLIINDIKALAAMNILHNTNNTTYTIFDEFSVFADGQVVNLINQGRSAGICAVLATQSLADMVAIKGKSLLEQIINNCNNYIIQRQNNHDDAVFLANIVGKHDALDYSFKLMDDHTITPSNLKSKQQFTIDPELIKQLQLGEAIVVNKLSGDIHQLLVNKSMI